jgi:hypothetical protein
MNNSDEDDGYSLEEDEGEGGEVDDDDEEGEEDIESDISSISLYIDKDHANINANYTNDLDDSVIKWVSTPPTKIFAFNNNNNNSNNKMQIENYTQQSSNPCKASGQNKLSIKSVSDLDFEESQTSFLKHESIMSVVLYECCKKQCLAKISPNSVYGDYSTTYELIKACRLELIGLNEEQRMDEIRKLITGTVARIFFI